MLAHGQPRDAPAPLLVLYGQPATNLTTALGATVSSLATALPTGYCPSAAASLAAAHAATLAA